jgi:hypothetical protein
LRPGSSHGHAGPAARMAACAADAGLNSTLALRAAAPPCRRGLPFDTEPQWKTRS